MNQPAAPPSPDGNPPKADRASLWILLSVVVVDLIGFGVVIPILPYYAESYGASATVLGLLLTSYAAMQFVFAPIWGRLSDRIGRRPVLLMTLAGTAASLLFLGLAPTLPWLFVARLLAGAFGANISVATAYITDVTGEAERTRWMGLIGAAFGVGFLLGPALGGALAPFGYSVPILAAAGLAAINLVYAGFSLREPPRHVEVAGELKARLRLLDVLRGPAGRLCLGCFVFTFSVSQLETVFAFFMMDRFGYDARHVAAILVFMAVITAGIQGGAIRHLALRFGERRLLLTGCLLLGVSFATVPWARPVLVLLAPLAVSAAGRAVAYPSLLSLVSKTAAAGERGAVMGAFQSSASLARVLGPTTAGLLYDLAVPTPFLLAGLLAFLVPLLASSRDFSLQGSSRGG